MDQLSEPKERSSSACSTETKILPINYHVQCQNVYPTLNARSPLGKSKAS